MTDMTERAVRVFLVDDSSVFLWAASTFFSTESRIDVVGTARSGEAALKVFAEIQPDVVLVDHRLPMMDGLETTRRLKQANPTLTVIMVTASCSDEHREAAAAAGADAVIIANNVAPDTPWSGLRIWDYSDPTAPVLASTFNTDCSAAFSPIEGCDPFGTYSVHNVIVETTGNKTKAYVSWYNDGMLVLDVSDPYNPVETARYIEPGTDYWGVDKEKNSPFFYGSDRNGGLDVFKEQGSGSGKK